MGPSQGKHGRSSLPSSHYQRDMHTSVSLIRVFGMFGWVFGAGGGVAGTPVGTNLMNIGYNFPYP